ncbi:TolC family protein [Candidatus Sumerlaeota bacterium]|nr:TolC family protein [Candidatus Sumerlaeota bacterium]
MNPHLIRRRVPKRLALPMCIVALLATSCARYERQPLDHRAFAESLDKRLLVADNSGAPRPRRELSMSLEEAEAIALFYNATVRAARLRAQIPVVAARKAGKWDNPEISGDVLRIMESVEEPWIIGSSLAFTIPISGRLSVERAKADAEAHAAMIEAWSIEQSVLKDLRGAWIDWQSRQRALASSRRTVEEFAGITGITTRLEKAGELITAEGVAFRLAEARAKSDSARLASEVEEARHQVLALAGLMPDAPITLLDEDAPTDDALVIERQALLSGNPEVLLRAAEYDVAEEGLRLEVRRQYPDLQIGPAYGREDALGRIGVSFSIPLPLLNRNGRAIAEARASRDAARGAWEEAVQHALAESARLNAKLQAAQQSQGLLSESLAPLATTQMEEARRLADQGEVNALLLLEALNAQRDVTLELVNAKAEVARLRLALKSLAPEPPPALAEEAAEK